MGADINQNDIELRFIIKYIVETSHGRNIFKGERVLQFRKYVEHIGPKHRYFDWTEWRDVPFVEDD